MGGVMFIAAIGFVILTVGFEGMLNGNFVHLFVYLFALVFGAIFSGDVEAALMVTKDVSYSTQALKVIENVGLILFVTAVGFIAGPNFFKILKKNYKSFILLGVIVILSGALACIGCYYVGVGFEDDPKEFVAMLDGILSGALTTTPGFSAAKATVENLYGSDPAKMEAYEAAVTVGHGIAYLFGVVGVVLFVQLIPKFTKANMEEERAKLMSVDMGEKKEYKGKLIDIDPIGIAAFALAAFIGIFVGCIKVPLSGQGLSGNTFSLTTTGGTLITALVFGHFAHFGPINVTPNKKMLEVLRELGLMLFLIGAGVAGGAKFVEYFKAVYFLYGIVMTLVPMIVGYLFAKYVLKLSLLNNLGSITGGMTSTPALGTLISVAGTDEVASAYAATYPIALLAIVLVSQFLLVLL